MGNRFTAWLADPWTAGQAIVYGTLAVAVLDGLAAIVSIYLAVSRAIPALAQRPLLYGPLYGIAAFFVMNYAVIPLSVIGRVIVQWPGAVQGLLIHALVVGPPV